MHTALRIRPAVLAVSLALMLAASSALAQTTYRSGIEGKVTDDTGAILPGATVTISSPALQTPQLVATTDGDGRFRFAALPAGVYAVTFELQGFQSVRREGVRIDAGFVATIDIKLAIGEVKETVTVTGESPVVDVRTTSVSTNFTKEVLETVPTSRTMWQILSMSPGVRMTSATPDVGGSQTGNQAGYATYGTAAGGNRPTLDGVETREETGAAGFYYDYGAFEEVQIKAMGNDAEMALAGTAFVGIIKSGSNTFHGGSLFQWETPTLQSDNIDDELRAKGVKEGNPLKAYYDFNVDLGGRIVRDRVWFFGAARRQNIRTGVIGYSRTAGADGVYGTADDEPGEYENNLTNYTGKVTAQLNPNHKLTSFYQWNRKLYPERGGDAYTPAESTIRNQLTPYATKIEWTWVATSNSLVNFLVGRHFFLAEWPAAYPGSGPARYDTVTLRNSGTSVINDTSNSERGRWQYTASYSHYLRDFLGGNHDLKAGVDFTREEYVRNIRARGADGDYQLRLQNGAPFEIVTYNSPFRSITQENMQSAYVRDSWSLGDRLTLNLGVRTERYSSYLPAQSKPAGVFSEAASYPKMDIMTWTGVVPRFGFSYALTSDMRNVVKVTYGLFNFPLLPDYSRDFNANDIIRTTYRWSDANRNGDYDPGELGTFVRSTGAKTRVLNPDLKQPKTQEFTATFERELRPLLSARASYVYKKDYRLYQDVNTARPYEVFNLPITTTDPGPDGRLGTPDDGGPVTYYDYDPAYRGAAFERIIHQNTDDYQNLFQNIEVVVNKRMADRWQLLTSMLATHRDVWRSGIPQTPNVSNFQPKDQTWEWSFRVAGSYLLPLDIQVAGFFSHQSGAAIAREVRFTTGLRQLTEVILLMEPVGAQRRPNQNLLSLRAEKRFKLNKGGEFSFQFDVFNTLNANVATTSSVRSGTTYGQITAIVPPRVARLGLTYRF